MSNNRVQTTLRFEEDLFLKITYIAKKNRRSFNAQLEFLAQECIEAYELEKGEIKISEDERGLR